MSEDRLVSVLVLPGCRMSNAYGLGDVFTIAQTINNRCFGGTLPRIRARRVSLSGRSVRSHGGEPIAVEGQARASSLGDALFVPGGSEDTPEHEAARVHHQAVTFLRGLRRRRRLLLAAQCMASFLFAEAGLLDGREATASWWAQPTFRQSYPNVQLNPEAMMTVDGNVACIAGPCSQPLLAIYLIERLVSPALASLCGKYAAIDRSTNSQLPFAGGGLELRNNLMAYRARQLVLAALPAVLTVPDLAKGLSMTVRTLQRQLAARTSLAPKAFIDHVRHERAKELLETTEDSLASVLARTGFGDESSFRRSFRRHVHMTPAAYRRRYGPAATKKHR